MARDAVRPAAPTSKTLRATVVAVAGSVGKTTTCLLTSHALGAHGVAATHRLGSNRAKSVTATVRAAPDADYLVQEVGTAGPDSLDELLWTLEPDVAIVTAVASDHFGAFHSLESVQREKAKAVAALSGDGIAILNADDDRVVEMARFCRGRVVAFGSAPGADVRVSDIRGGFADGVAFRAHTDVGELDVATRLLGSHQVAAASAALACALALGCPPGPAIAAIAAADPAAHRLSLLTAPGMPTFLLDDRKASVATVAPAFSAPSSVPTTSC